MVCYLWYRTNFYSVPIAASLFLSVLGLWLWLGAAKRVPVSGDRIREVDGTQSLSLPHLAAGSMCIAANLGSVRSSFSWRCWLRNILAVIIVGCFSVAFYYFFIRLMLIDGNLAMA